MRKNYLIESFRSINCFSLFVFYQSVHWVNPRPGAEPGPCPDPSPGPGPGGAAVSGPWSWSQSWSITSAAQKRKLEIFSDK